MADGAQKRSRRFSAFISYNYNRRDRKFARRLHRELESYRLPHRLAHKPATSSGPADRLKPVFRDADEMTAAPDLSEAVREALAESDYLIVVCSPASAASVWVGHEIDLFRALHGDRHILTALIDGTPQTAFHPALRQGPAGDIEPLAADFRPEGGGKRMAMLKLVGALAGVRLDDLIHRDAQRQMRRMVTAGASGLAATVTVATLGVLAYTANADAERRRTETTGLVEYMLTDLRKTMQRTGRLDQLAALNDGAMQYYRNQNLKKLSEAQLRQRAKLLQAMGEDDEKRGKLKEARASFDDAHRTTAALLDAKPNDPNRIFAHAQSEYWVGFINWQNGDGTAARRGMEAYATLAQRLVALQPGNDNWLMERAYAYGSLGTLILRQTGSGAAAQSNFLRALQDKQTVARHEPQKSETLRSIAQTYAWLADSQRLQGKFDAALASRAAQGLILGELMKASPSDLELQGQVLGLRLALARIEADRGHPRKALEYLALGKKEAGELSSRDPDNEEVARQQRAFRLFEARVLLSLPRTARPNSAIATFAALEDCKPKSATANDRELDSFCKTILIRKLREDGRAQEASTLARSLFSTQSERVDVLTPTWGIDIQREFVPTS